MSTTSTGTLDAVGLHRPALRSTRSCEPSTPAAEAVEAKVLWR
ncbi:hypothetical protein ACGFQG_27255 [Nocardia fluminea]